MSKFTARDLGALANYMLGAGRGRNYEKNILVATALISFAQQKLTERPENEFSPAESLAEINAARGSLNLLPLEPIGGETESAPQPTPAPTGQQQEAGARVDPLQLRREGGAWLGAARSWLQWHTRNGDRVTWGSTDAVDKTFTVRDVEELAAEVAAAAMNSRPPAAAPPSAPQEGLFKEGARAMREFAAAFFEREPILQDEYTETTRAIGMTNARAIRALPLPESLTKAAPLTQDAAELLQLRQQVEDTVGAAQTEADAEGWITAYHFKTGAIHRLLAMARDIRDGQPQPFRTMPPGPQPNNPVGERAESEVGGGSPAGAAPAHPAAPAPEETRPTGLTEEES